MVNRAAYSGSWYASGATILASDLDRFIESVAVRQAPGRPLVGAVLPHAGLSYSGRGMAHAFARFAISSGQSPSRVLVVAPSHYESIPADTLCLECFSEHETPLGSIPGDPRFADAALASAGRGVKARIANLTVEREHAVELFLPFVRRVLPDTPLNAVVVGPVSSLDAAENAAETIGVALGDALDTTLVIASSDFTHYGRRFGHTPFGVGTDVADRVADRDSSFARWAAQLDSAAFFAALDSEKPTICGRFAMLITMALERRRGSTGSVADYYTSNEITRSVAADFVCYATVLYE